MKPTPRWVVFLAPIPLGLVALGVVVAARPSVSGQLSWTSAQGARTLVPDDCESSFRRNVEGVVLRVGSAPDVSIELLRDHSKRPLARIRNSGSLEELRARDCALFELELESIRQTNHTDSYRGTARIDCKSRLFGSVGFAGCHVP
jgi:hypothetical protein